MNDIRLVTDPPDLDEDLPASDDGHKIPLFHLYSLVTDGAVYQPESVPHFIKHEENMESWEIRRL